MTDTPRSLHAVPDPAQKRSETLGDLPADVAKRIHRDVMADHGDDRAARLALEMRAGVRAGYAERMRSVEEWVCLLSEYLGHVARHAVDLPLADDEARARLRRDAYLEACLLAAGAMELARTLEEAE